MKKQITWVISFFSILLFTALSIEPVSATTSKTVQANKEWTIQFSLPIVKSSLTDETVYVLNEKGEKQAVTLKANNKFVYVQAPQNGYVSGQTYELVVTNKLLGQAPSKQKAMAKSYSMKFQVADTYEVVQFTADGTQSVVASYSTFEEAANTLQANQGVLLNGNVLKVASGYVATSPAKVTLLYKTNTLAEEKVYAGVAADTELHYVDSTEDYIEVAIGGQNLFVKHEDVTILPSIQVPNPSYYKATSAGLQHAIYRPHAKKHDGSYTIGENPSFMTIGEKYYSTDGFTFYDAAGNFVGEAYSYFQYLSPRTASPYTAEELDAYLLNRLKQVEQQNPAQYKDASTKSRLIGIGADLKAIEQEQRINALWLLSIAINESGYGMSCHALHNNNLFGFKVTDSAVKCVEGGNKDQTFYYPTVKANLNAVTESLNGTYLNPEHKSNFRYHGAAFGNKMVGMNVRYASDPYWGQKNAGHLYRMDKELGGSMYKAYDLAITSQNYVNVRIGPGTSYKSAYQYRLDGTIKRFDKLPLTLSNTASDHDQWIRLVSELPYKAEDVYTHYENVHKISTY